jgi:ATP-binding cassette subfamily C (CFTR/MRP) protein 1
MLILGQKRPLTATDMWKLQDDQSSAYLADKLNLIWDRRCAEADEFNLRLERGEVKPGVVRRAKWVFGKGSQEAWNEGKEGRKEASLVWTCNEVFARWFWIGGAYKSEHLSPLSGAAETRVETLV